MQLERLKRVIRDCWSQCEPVVKRLLRGVRAVIARGWRELKAISAYYWAHRGGLWKLFAEYVPFFKEHGTRTEIWVSQEDGFESVSFDGTNWQARLPDCCAVCGEPADDDWQEEERLVPDLTWPLLCPLAALGLGALLGVLFPNGWLLPGALLIGLWMGYRRRGETHVRLRFRRCRQHANQKDIPRPRTCKKWLIIDVGHRSVYRKFWDGERQAGRFQFRGRQRSDTVREHRWPLPTWEPADHDPAPIPLAGDEEPDSDFEPKDDLPSDSSPTDEDKPSASDIP